MEKGLIVKSLGGFYYVKLADGRVISCRAKGGFRNSGETPFVGDTVDIRIVSEELLEGYVEKIYPRKNKIVRPPVANIDRLIIVSALKSPAPDTVFIDKMTVMCEHYGITPVLCFNKTDLKSGEKLAEQYKGTGYKIYLTSAGEGRGIDELKEIIGEGITAVAGFSGVGKSSILNKIKNEEISETGSVSKKLSRGKHTTRHTELFELKENCYIADTPGFSGLSIETLTKEELPSLFTEFKKYASECRFCDCVHMGEKDCGIKNAVAEGKIASSRYESYVNFYNVLKEINDWERK